MKTIEKLFWITTALIVLFLTINGIYRYQNINKDGVFVLAKVKKISDTENGLIYDFAYIFNNKVYTSHVKGFITMKDSLIILKISKTKPHLWKYINVDIPDCVLKSVNTKKYWDKFPFCD